MPKYVDGFVLVVPKKNVAAYRKMATEGAKMWMKYGALEYFECQGDDLNPNTDMGGMKALTFPQMTKLKKNETVWFSFIVYKSKKHRDQVNKKVMAQMSKDAEKYKDMKMPFDMRRMAYGGFKAIVTKP
ncbi:DUF1428 domain-containing protein [Candidatus Uhrbacteria bacterium]|nr:MAG: DUF1428 domain-containing protein [Candidatus Uhrbacteria bacterium]